MGWFKRVWALRFIRKLRGGSQPILVEASDGLLYVVKFLNNLQGPNLPFNDALGTELFRSAGLPAPRWCLVHISAEFLDKNPECWMETQSGRQRPAPGWCFGSQFLSLRPRGLFEILPKRSFIRVQNRSDFWTAWVLDVFCGHADNRQAIFVQGDSGWLQAFFIDHGHLFGGANGTASPSFLASRFLDSRIYIEPTEELADYIQRAIQSIDLAVLAAMADSLPDEWKLTTALSRFGRFTEQISDPVLLRNIVHFILGSVEHVGSDYGRDVNSDWITPNRKSLYTAIPQI